MAFVQTAEQKPSVRIDDSLPVGRCAAPTDTGGDYTVTVRELCASAAKEGDLDLRFTPSPTAEEGIAGHRVVASRRGSTQFAMALEHGIGAGAFNAAKVGSHFLVGMCNLSGVR